MLLADPSNAASRLMSSTVTQDTSSLDIRQKISKAIYVVGPSSSGKTTLCNALAAQVHLDPARHIEEVARTVMRTQGFSRHTVHTYEMQHAIMVAQAKEEQRVISMSIDATSRLQLLSDRSTIDPIVYASISGGPDAEEMHRRLLSEPAFLQVLPLYRRSLFGESNSRNADLDETYIANSCISSHT